MLNKTRQLYQQVMQINRHSEAEKRRIIEDGTAVKNFRKTRVAKILEEWIEEQRKGQHDYMRVEIGSLTGLNLLKWINAFLKYTYLVQEDRAFRKMEAFLDSVERNGAKYEEELRRAAERTAAKDSDRQK